MALFKTASVLSLGLLLAACGTLISTPTQEVTVNTPGAEESKCTIENGLRYQLNGGQTIRIMRSENDMIVDCYASGNRHRRMKIDVAGNKWSMLNAANGVIPGLAYDHFAKGLYEYPDVVTIDFTGVPVHGFELPAYHDKTMPNPYEQAIENYGPTRPRLESDRTRTHVIVQKVDPKESVIDPSLLYDETFPPPVGQGGESTVSGTPGYVGGTQIQGSDAEELTRSANPDVFDK